MLSNHETRNEPQAVISVSELSHQEQATLREMAKFLAFYYPQTVRRGDYEQAAALMLFFSRLRKVVRRTSA